MKDYKRKLDYRLGLSMIFALACISGILLVYGLFYERVHGSMLDYIDGVRRAVEVGELAAAASVSGIQPRKRSKRVSGDDVMATDTIRAPGAVVGPVESEQMTTNVPPSGIVPTPTTAAVGTVPPPVEESTVSPAAVVPQIPVEMLRVEELDGYAATFGSVRTAIWLLFWLNLIAMTVLVTSTYLFHSDYTLGRKLSYKLVYRVSVGVLNVSNL